MEPNKIKEIISEPKNQSNIDLMECMDFLSNEHEQLKDTILKLTYHLDEVVGQPAIIVGDTEEKTHVGGVNLKDNGSIDVKFKNGYTINLSQKDFSEITLRLPLRFKRK